MARGAEEVFLVLVVVVEQGRIDAGFGRNRLDRDGGIPVLRDDLQGHC